MKIYFNTLLLNTILIIMLISKAQANEKIAVVNIYDIFQKSIQKIIITEKLEKEFKNKIIDLQKIENDLQNKIQHLKYNNKNINTHEKQELEKSIIAQKKIFSKKVKIFEEENIKRQNEEKNKFLEYIRKIIKNIAVKKGYDIVIDSDSIFYINNKIKNITPEILNKINE
ncbi:Chaperone protein Skp [Candidatus Westeberhardia cardiocondylae]|uniref:Chaperone protein Skp n=2 Tax=Candidatus Westeberhardia cardiocondylae TaxID=1594731 RepID=A0A0H5C5Q1_9ENTR|nr:Chaperone protein Skp [Candidatus Westeberhardia cardiocondylae]